MCTVRPMSVDSKVNPSDTDSDTDGRMQGNRPIANVLHYRW